MINNKNNHYIPSYVHTTHSEDERLNTVDCPQSEDEERGLRGALLKSGVTVRLRKTIIPPS